MHHEDEEGGGWLGVGENSLLFYIIMFCLNRI